MVKVVGTCSGGQTSANMALNDATVSYHDALVSFDHRS